MIVRVPILSGRYFPALTFAFCSGLVAFSANISGPVTDNFHEGEFLGFVWHMRDYYRGMAQFPLLVHGGMDYLPSLMALHLFGTEHAIVGTRIILVLLTAVQYFSMLDTCHLLAREKNGRRIWIAVIVFYFLYTTPQLNASIIEAVYFPVRDLCLSLTVWCLVRYTSANDRYVSRFFLVFGSFWTVISFFWCYNRGIMTIAFSGVFLGGLIFRNRLGSALLMLAATSASLTLMEVLKIAGSSGENLDNILYWLKHAAEVNRMRLSIQYAAGFAGLAALCLFFIAVLVLILALRKNRVVENPLLIFVVAGLCLIQTLSIKTVFGVPDLEYALNGGWPSVMLLLLYGSRLLILKTGDGITPMTGLVSNSSSLGKSQRRAMYFSLAALLLFLFVSHHNVAVTYVRFAKNIIAPVPNGMILSPDVLQLGSVLRDQDDPAYFNWANDGIVAFLSQKRLATRFPYVHYVAGSRENELLTQLEQASPSVIVMDSNQWPFTRHKERMELRLPATYHYISEHYGTLASFGNYQVAYKQLK